MIRRGGDRHVPASFIDTSSRKKIWTSSEDEVLKNLVQQHGTKDWLLIAESLSGRTGKQCRERWHNHLDCGIKKGDWTEEEDEIIFTMQKALGNQWAKITKMLPGRTDNAVKNRFHITERLRSREKGDHLGKSVSDDTGNIDGSEVFYESSASDVNGKKRPASCLQNTRKTNQSEEVLAISPGHHNDSSSKRFSNSHNGSAAGSMHSPTGLNNPSSSSSSSSSSSRPSSWSHLNAPTLESTLIDDSNTTVNLYELDDSLPFRKEDFVDEAPNLLDFLENDTGQSSSEEVVDAMQRFYPFQSSSGASSTSPMNNNNNIISANNKYLVNGATSRDIERLSWSGSKEIQPHYHWQDGNGIVHIGSIDGQASSGKPGDEEKVDAGSDEGSGGSSENDLMDMDIISFDDQQIYLDDQTVSRRDHGGSYDTDSDDGLETCGVSGSTACVSAGAMGVGTLQHTAVAAMSAVFNWRDGHRLNADGINIQESEEQSSFDFDQCCFINPFEWGGSSSNIEADRRTRRRQSNKSLDIHTSDPNYSTEVFPQSERPAMSSSSRRGMRAAVSTVTSNVCSGFGMDSHIGSACSCGTEFCGGCSSFRHSPLSMHSSLQGTSSSAPNYVLYSNPSLYSLNDSLEAVTELQDSAANTGFGFGFGSISDSGGATSSRPSSFRAPAAVAENDCLSARHHHQQQQLQQEPPQSQQQQLQQQQQSEATSSSTSSTTQHSQWKPNFSSYSSSASSMASYFWSNSMR